MYWYNPKSRTSERVEAPSTDEQAIRMLAGTQKLRGVHKGVLPTAPIWDTNRASASVGGPRVPLEATGGSASSPVGDTLRRSGVPVNFGGSTF